jgi:signal transduction histidine kinase
MKCTSKVFSRTGIDVDLIVSRKARRLPSEIETDLFRVVQESHQHSPSLGQPRRIVRLMREPGRVLLQIRDWGCGMPASIAQSNGLGYPGVGIAGMRERLAQLKGGLEIQSSGEGTTVTAVVPLANKSPIVSHATIGQKPAS